VSLEIVHARLSFLEQVLQDLKPHVDEARSEQEKAHYEIERQVQLAVDLSSVIGRRILTVEGKPAPEASRDVFKALCRSGVISEELAESMGKASGLGTLLAPEQGELHYALFFRGLPDGYRAFVEFAESARRFLGPIPGGQKGTG